MYWFCNINTFELNQRMQIIKPDNRLNQRLNSNISKKRQQSVDYIVT